MKNDITYEYRVFTNRLIDVEAMEVGICTSKVIKELKPKNKVDGRFFHTSDTDEWYFCWKGELQKLNLKGNSDVNAALDEVKKLIGDANAAVEVAKSTAKAAQQAATDAKNAADAASAAVESIENKADKTVVDELSASVANKADVSVVNTLSQTITEKADKSELDSKADASVVKELSDKVADIDLTDYAKKLELEGYLTKSEAESTYAKIGSGSSDGVDLSNYATKEYVGEEIAKIVFPEIPEEYVTESELSQKGYLTEHQDISGKQDKIDDLDAIREGATLGATAIQSLEGYATEEFVTNKGYVTTTQLEAKQDIITDLDEIRANASNAIKAIPSEYITEDELTNKGYITEDVLSQKGFATTEQLNGKQDEIDDLDAIREGAALGATAIQSLEGYATESFVNEEIKKINVPTMDNYYTKEEIDSKLSVINDLIGQVEEITNKILA